MASARRNRCKSKDFAKQRRSGDGPKGKAGTDSVSFYRISGPFFPVVHKLLLLNLKVLTDFSDCRRGISGSGARSFTRQTCLEEEITWMASERQIARTGEGRRIDIQQPGTRA